MPVPTSVAYASTTIGFVSFAFTFFTLVRVFWETLVTLAKASGEVPDALDNLRSELQSERLYFKHKLHRSVHARSSRSRDRYGNRGPFAGEPYSSPADIATLRLLSDSVKHLMGRFRRVEEPFLVESASWRERNVEGQHVREEYAPMTLKRRWIWMRNKNSVMTMATLVTRIQTRRIAYDTSCALA